MSGLAELTLDQQAIQQAIQQSFDEKKQGWKDRYLTEFRRILKSKESFRVALCGHANTTRNGSNWAPVTVAELDQGLLALTTTDAASLSFAFANRADWERNINGVAWSMFSKRIGNFMQGATDAEAEQERGLGLTANIVRNMRECDVLAYETAHCEAGGLMGLDFPIHWLGDYLTEHTDADVEYLSDFVKKFGIDLNAAMQEIVLQDLYEQAYCAYVLSDLDPPNQAAFKTPINQDNLIYELNILKNTANCKRYTAYDLARAHLVQTLGRQDLNPPQRALQPIGQELLALIDAEEALLNRSGARTIDLEGKRAKLTTTLEAVNTAITTPTAANARHCIEATQDLSNYSSKQKKRWAIACIVLLSLLAVGIIVGVAMTGALPVLAALAPIEEALVAGCVTAGIMAGAATAPVAKGAHVAFSKSPIQKQARKIQEETQALAG